MADEVLKQSLEKQDSPALESSLKDLLQVRKKLSAFLDGAIQLEDDERKYVNELFKLTLVHLCNKVDEYESGQRK